MNAHPSPAPAQTPGQGCGQGIGARLPRKEDARHLHGRGNFIANMSMHGLGEVAFLRSPLAHARITRTSVAEAAQGSVWFRSSMPDVQDIVADSTLPSYQVSGQPPLAHDKVRFVGEPVAMAVAHTRAQAEDLLEMIDVQYDELPVWVDAQAAMQARGELMHSGWKDNVFVTLKVDKRFDELAARADLVVHRTFKLSRQCMLPMEGIAVMAWWDHAADQLVVSTSTQVPHMIRTAIALFLGMHQEQVRVISPDVGGGFGYKCIIQPEELCVAWLAKTFKRPFRYLEDRREHLIAGANTREHHYEMTGYISKTGRLLALDAKITINGGAYSVWPFTQGLEGGQAVGNLPGPYALEGYRCVTQCVATNKPPFLPYRGVARTGVCFAIELLMDAIAREVGRQAWQVRCENLVQPEQMPYVNVTNKHLDGGDYPASLMRARDMINLDAWRVRQRQPDKDGRLLGVGFATYAEQAAHGTSVFAAWGTPVIPGFDQVYVRITPDGGLEIRAGIHSHGQGMETTFAQIAHEILGIDVSRIRLVHGDTGCTPYSTGTYASRSLVMSGGAVAVACKALLPRILKIGAHLLQTDPARATFRAGAVWANERCAPIAQIADAWYLNPQKLPPDVDPGGLEVSRGYKPRVDTGCFSYCSQAAVIALDPQTGGIEILDYVVVEDCGVMVNPMVVEGQTTGGIAQGIGTALYEEMPYDEFGTPLASTLADYVMPGATEVPRLRIEHFETPSPHTEFGAKGMGEGGGIAPPAVLFNAVNDALHTYGFSAEVTQTPLTPERMLTVLMSASSGTPGKQMIQAPEPELEAMLE